MYDLTKILPHKPPMILLDDIVNVDIEHNNLTAVFHVPEQKNNETFCLENKESSSSLFYEKGKGISSVVGIEYMAQTIGCYAYFKNKCEKPKVGLLLGARLYNNKIDYFKEGEEYRVVVSEVFSDDKIAAFDCIIYDKNSDEIASSTINVYEGDVIKEFIDE